MSSIDQNKESKGDQKIATNRLPSVVMRAVYGSSVPEFITPKDFIRLRMEQDRDYEGYVKRFYQKRELLPLLGDEQKEINQ